MKCLFVAIILIFDLQTKVWKVLKIYVHYYDLCVDVPIPRLITVCRQVGTYLGPSRGLLRDS